MPIKNNAAEFTASKVTGLRNRALTIALSFAVAVGLSATVSLASPQQATDSAESKVTATAPLTTITLTADGLTKQVATSAKTVAELLKEQEISLGKLDRASVSLSTPITADMASVVVTRIHTDTVKERVSLPFTTRKKFTQNLPFGKTKVVVPGVKGERVKTFRVTYKDDTEVARVKTGETNKAPKTALVLAGTRGMTFSNALASRGYFGGRRIMTMRATGYGPGDNGRWGAQTATGLRPGYGVVAVDPRFIPLGTRLYIEGYGYAVAGDTGGAIKGNRIDLGHDSASAAEAVGRRNVRVLILN